MGTLRAWHPALDCAHSPTTGLGPARLLAFRAHGPVQSQRPAHRFAGAREGNYPLVCPSTCAYPALRNTHLGGKILVFLAPILGLVQALVDGRLFFLGTLGAQGPGGFKPRKIFNRLGTKVWPPRNKDPLGLLLGNPKEGPGWGPSKHLGALVGLAWGKPPGGKNWPLDKGPRGAWGCPRVPLGAGFQKAREPLGPLGFQIKEFAGKGWALGPGAPFGAWGGRPLGTLGWEFPGGPWFGGKRRALKWRAGTPRGPQLGHVGEPFVWGAPPRGGPCFGAHPNTKKGWGP